MKKIDYSDQIVVVMKHLKWSFLNNENKRVNISLFVFKNTYVKENLEFLCQSDIMKVLFVLFSINFY